MPLAPFNADSVTVVKPISFDDASNADAWPESVLYLAPIFRFRIRVPMQPQSGVGYVLVGTLPSSFRAGSRLCRSWRVYPVPCSISAVGSSSSLFSLLSPSRLLRLDALLLFFPPKPIQYVCSFLLLGSVFWLPFLVACCARTAEAGSRRRRKRTTTGRRRSTHRCESGRPGGVSGYPRSWYIYIYIIFVGSSPPECILV